MPRLFFEVPTRLRWWMGVLALLPCAPGLTFLLAGWMLDPRVPAQGSPEVQRAAQKARGLYRAGEATLGMGAVFGLVVGWQVFRRREEAEDEEKTP